MYVIRYTAWCLYASKYETFTETRKGGVNYTIRHHGSKLLITVDFTSTFRQTDTDNWLVGRVYTFHIT